MASSVDGASGGDKPPCVPCSSMDSSFLLSDEQIHEVLSARLPLWRLSLTAPEGRKCISRKFTARNFQSALDCINSMGTIAERESHHPDFHITNYRDVEVVLFTHKLGGVTQSDLSLAKMLDDEVKVDYSPKWLKSYPEAESTASKTI